MNFPKLIVQADPIHAGKHPYHDNRFITTNHRLELEVDNTGETDIRFVEGDGEQMIVAKMTDCQNQAEFARLFAAAPELLEALNLLFEHCEMVHRHWGEGCNRKEADEAIKLARQAIAKAEGKAVES